ncbi:hypothetical protein MMC25_003091 [Agyrium rufum]|nr:hypothetical protein [Agyrium rufum]
MSSCFGFRKGKGDDREPLLPRYENDTALQRQLQQKLHTYQMYRALAKGFMPSNEQIIINLRSLLAADILNPSNEDLSDSGRLLIKNTRQWLQQFIETLNNKNGSDEIQDFIWYLTKSRVSLDTDDLLENASKIKSKADSAAAYESLRTVGSLLLTNSDFRIFLSDLNVVGRQIFSETAFSLSNVAEEAGKKLEPSNEQHKTIEGPGADDGPPPSSDDLENKVADVSKIVGNGLVETGKGAVASAQANVTGEQKDTLINRLQQAILKLRQRNDYSDSVSTLGILIKRYAVAYSRAADATISTAQRDVNTNPALDRAVRNFWSLLSSFGDREQWKLLEQKVNKVMLHSQNDPEFESLMGDVAQSVQKLLTDPDFFQSADRKIQELREKSKSVGKDSSLRKDIDDALGQFQTTFVSVTQDPDISNLTSTTLKIVSILSPVSSGFNKDLLNDCLHVFIPLLISAIQYLPIPRLEVSTPELDLLLENLIIEPGRTINHTSFLPYKLRLETQNDLEIRAARHRTTTQTTSLLTIKLDGLSVRAEEIGFWLRAHSGFLLRFADEGLASFALDERGIDIHIDVEIGRERMEQILTLKAVRVNVHKLTYNLRKSKLSWIAWLFKPLLKPILKRTIEVQLAHAIADALHAANRELLFARERLRATRISDPKDLRTFVKAIMTRLTPEEDPDVYTAVGVTPSKGIFKGVYAPGSLVKLWEDEGRQAVERVEDGEVEGWRNEVFDLHTMMMS